MKVLTKTGGMPINVFEDSMDVTITDSQVEVGNPLMYVNLDYNNSNCNLYTDVNLPDDYAAQKYTFDGESWTLNPDWIEPIDTSVAE
tara:strand:- start:55 stop:315 length:261 start_codon:yes stop_codon:yes gene_type:complete